MLHAGGTHWAFSLAFAVGLVALVSKNSGMSKKQGLFWMLMAVLAHFFLNTPFNEGLTSNSGEITVLMLCFSFCVALAAFFKVDQIETNQYHH